MPVPFRSVLLCQFSSVLLRSSLLIIWQLEGAIYLFVFQVETKKELSKAAARAIAVMLGIEPVGSP